VKEKTGGQMFFSSTKSGKTRGNHYHRRKIERFFVIKGVALLKLRKIGSARIFEYNLNGEKPSFVDIPIHYAHNITNIGNEDLITLFWANELFNTQDTDTFPENV
jgi:UDP-2-acetamido-2,6-beta-L-arabino-hexul-4-ose reductase